MIDAGRDASSGDLGLVVAEHFDLGRPLEAMAAHQHTSFRTWRLRTARGSFLVKELWASRPPYWGDKVVAMTGYEQLARGSGIRIPHGYASDGRLLAQLGDVGAFKVYEWLEHSPLVFDGRLAEWLGRTLARLHLLGHADPDLTPASDWFGVFDRSTWNGWLDAARARGLDWDSHVSVRVPRVLEISDRISQAWESRSDVVVSHGDLEPQNVLAADSGLFLIDWESVGWESVSLELGRTLFAFGEHDLSFCGALLDSYAEAGGRPPLIDDAFGLRAVAHKLGNLTELVRVSVDDAAPTGWMQSAAAVPQAVEEFLSMSERTVDWSRRLAAARS